MYKQYNQIWEDFLGENYFPTYLRNIQEIPLKDFTEAVLTSGKQFIRDFLEGDVFVIKNVLDFDTAEQIKKDVYEYGNNTPEECLRAESVIPNFHYRSSGGQVKDGYNEFAHSYNFWRWNTDDLKIFERVDHFWNIIKILNGLGKNGLKSNLPKDKIIDRIQILHYPINVGKITPHCDVARWQKTNVAISLTEMGKDFDTGGLYCLNKDEQKIKIESRLNTGDSVVWLPTIFHGVDEPKRGKTVNWSTTEGRWQLLAQSIQSWDVQNRVVSVSYKNFKKNPEKTLKDYMFYEGV